MATDPSTAIARRTILLGSAAAALLAMTRSGAATPGLVLLAAAGAGPDRHLAAGIAADGSVLFQTELPARGHGAAIDPAGRRAILFARRPGRFAVVIDLTRGEAVGQFTSPADRHFQGHGLFTADGGLLCAAENDFDGERGVIGLYDPGRNFRRVGELDAHGLDTHEMILLRDGRTIAAANGGILTHPDYPRAALNPAAMTPSLCFLDAGSGRLLAKHEPPAGWRQCSIRHVAEDGEGRVWFGCQYEGPALDSVPLIGRVGPGDAAIDWLRPDAGDERSLRQYVGSVAASGDGGRIAVSSPRGGTCLIFDAVTGGCQAAWRLTDVCGLAGVGPALIATDGGGAVWRDGALLARHPALAWDNHLTAITRL